MTLDKISGRLEKWQIDFFPAGCKGKRERITHRGTEHAAQKLEIERRRQKTKPPHQLTHPSETSSLNFFNTKLLRVVPSKFI